ncbi:TolC family protein [Aeromonas sp. 30P]|uniref:TolC family protein n=1 Tax=Aeromonas sp. 30P TaxID=3452717 RepID=UPI0038D2D544
MSNIGYHEYINEIYSSSPLVKIKERELAAEKNNYESVTRYYFPKISGDSKYKEREDGSKITESKLSASIVVYDDTTPNRIKESLIKLENAKLNVLKVKEQLKGGVTEQLINISYYNKLKDNAMTLKKEAESLLDKIKNKNNYGIVGSSDVQQAELLVKRIETEINLIEKNLIFAISTVESLSGVIYPSNGVEVPEIILDKISEYADEVSDADLADNLEYRGLLYAADAMKQNSKQQNSLFNVSLIAEQRYDDSIKVEKDSFIGVQVSFNIFDYDKLKASSSKVEIYESLLYSLDMKHRELLAAYKTNGLEKNSLMAELSDLNIQKKLTEKIMNSQMKGYDVGNVSFYEMLNTRFDFFNIERRISDAQMANKNNDLQKLIMTGRIFSLSSI